MTPVAPGEATLRRPVRELPLITNSVALIVAKVAAMGLGFLFWVVTARTFGEAEVGVAAAVVASMMLCTQIALLGVGSSFVAEFPAHREAVWPLLDAALTVVLPASVLTAGGFLVVAATLDHVDVVARSPVFAALFVAATVLGTVGVLLDQVSTALRRGDQSVVRGVAFGATCVVLLLVLVESGTTRSAQAAFAPWVAAGVVMCAAGALQLRRGLAAREVPPALDRMLAGRLMRVGVPNHVLTLAERTPGLALPLVVTQVLSPQANAAWYAAWMMAWVVFIVPIQVGMTIFAEVAADPASLRRALRRGVLTTVVIGGAAAVLVLVAAHPLLSLLGSGYADEGAAPLRILVLGIVPTCLTYAYFAACRALRRHREAIMSAWITGMLVLAVAVPAGGARGLTAIAAAWLAVQTMAGAWSAARLVQFARAPAVAAACGEPRR